jgi:hypothetical protein
MMTPSKHSTGTSTSMLTDPGAQASAAMAFDHDLKIDPDQLSELVRGAKTHEVRVFDRDYKVGQTLRLGGYDRALRVYTGEGALVEVTCITWPGTFGLPADVGVMSVRLVKQLGG